MRAAFLFVLSFAMTARAQVPAGHSARLLGVHDLDGAAIAFLTGSSSGCDHGWITHAQAIGHGGSAPGIDASGLRASGVSLIARLDDDWSRTVPTSAGELDGYARAFESTVASSPDVHVWIVGNEPNVTLGGQPSAYVAPYASAYVAVRNRVHAIAGHGADVVLLSAPSPWSPCFLDGFAQSIESVVAAGVTVDGFAIHAYSGHTSGSQDPALITSDQTGTVCPGGRYPTSSWQFRVYRDFLRVIGDTGNGGRPVYITESGHACEPSGNCYSDTDNGYFASMYAEIDGYIRSTGANIRAVTPYRWLPLGDGSPRDFTIGSRPALQRDLARGGAYTWATPSACAAGGCTDDGDCGAGQICDLGAHACVTAPSCPCTSGQVCRTSDSVCVPALRSTAGDTRIELVPVDPEVGSAVTIVVSATAGYTNIGLRWEGPLGSGQEPAFTDGRIPGWMGSRVYWEWDSTVPAAGAYRATFTADPGASTVYAIAYFEVGELPDAGMPSIDAGTTPVDAGSRDAGSGRSYATGCGCHIASSGTSGPFGSLAMLVVLACITRARGVRRI